MLKYSLIFVLWAVPAITFAQDEAAPEIPAPFSVMTPEQKRLFCLQPKNAGRNGCPPLPEVQSGGR